MSQCWFSTGLTDSQGASGRQPVALVLRVVGGGQSGAEGSVMPTPPHTHTRVSSALAGNPPREGGLEDWVVTVGHCTLSGHRWFLGQLQNKKHVLQIADVGCKGTVDGHLARVTTSRHVHAAWRPV